MKIEIRPAEGNRLKDPNLGKWVAFDKIEDANNFLYRQSHLLEKDQMGYNKHDFKITLDDGVEYKGRLDITKSGEDTDIVKHVKDFTKATAPPYPYTTKQDYKFMKYVTSELEKEQESELKVRQFQAHVFLQGHNESYYGRKFELGERPNESDYKKRKAYERKRDTGQGGYFRHRREHAINARKRRR